MDGFGNRLLARSAFARNQHRSIGTGYASTVFSTSISFGLTYNMAAIQCGSLLFRHLFRGGRKLKGRLDALQKSSIVPSLVMKSNAPACIPCTASWILPHAVIKITGTSGRNTFTCFNKVSPSSPVVERVKFISIKIKAGASALTISIASRGPEPFSPHIRHASA